MAEEARVAVVTGGAKGIGLGVVRALRREGWSVGVVDADAATEALAADAGATGVVAGVTDPAQLEVAFAVLAERLGRIAGLVNSAGINLTGPAEALSPELWKQVIDVDLSGTWYACQAAYPYLTQGGGAIVSIASPQAVRARAGRIPYAAAKAGVMAITRGLAIEWADRGIRVNAVAPGWTDTPLVRGQVAAGSLDLAPILPRVPLGRLATVDEIAETIVFLLSDRASYVTGETLFVDGGYTAAG
jgi:NAD(P)-dependent dehydrogenase (short-subunit alcohol dehydrogenase family)